MALLALFSAGSAGHASVTVSAGMRHTMIVTSDGTLLAFGNNGAGQLGDPTITRRALRPVRVASGVKSVATGAWHSLVVMADGTLWGMGWNSVGELGDGTKTSRLSPVAVATGVVAVATPVGTNVWSPDAARPHTMFVKADGSLWGMGSNFAGQLGDGTKEDRLLPVQVTTGVTSVAAGPGYTLFIKTDRTLWLVGRDFDERNLRADRLQPVQIASDVTAVSGGNGIAVFIRTDGTLWAFGDFARSTIRFSSPQQIASGVTFAAVGTNDVMYVKTDGTLWGFGKNSYGLLGNVGDANSWKPQDTAVQLASSVVMASPGDWHSVYVKTDGSVWAVGENGSGQLGDGTTVNRTAYVEVPGMAGLPFFDVDPTSQAVHGRSRVELRGEAKGANPISYQWFKDDVRLPGATEASYVIPEVSHDEGGTYTVQISNSLGSSVSPAADLLVVTPVQHVKAVAVSDSKTYFVLADGSLWATGSSQGQGGLGDGSTARHFTAVRVATGVTSVSAALDHTLFIKEDGTLWGMGARYYGDAGEGIYDNRLAPVQFASGVTAVSAGVEYAMFVKTDGTLWGMGFNGRGRFEGGGTVLRRDPVQVAKGVLSVSAGDGHTVFIKTDGTLWLMGECWFDGGSWHDTPEQVATDVAVASAGSGYTVFVKKDGTLWGFGRGSDGQFEPLGRGLQSQPVQLATGVRSAIATKQAYGQTFYIKTDGTLWGMGGTNGRGIFGDRVPSYFDGQVYLGYEQVEAVAGAASHTAFIRTDGTLWAMGKGFDGALGNGSSEDSRRPVQVTHGEDMPLFTTHPASASAVAGGAVSLSAKIKDAASPSLRWSRNGVPLDGPSSATLALSNLQPADSGLYTALVENWVGDVTSDAAIVGVRTDRKVIGSGHEVQSNTKHPNGNTFDQVLLTGKAEAVTAEFSPDPALNQITRTSYIDLDDDIVQVELSGPGTLSLVLDEYSPAAKPVNYNQDVNYVRGHAGIVITGATENTNVSVFSVGRATAVNPALFKTGVQYDGTADIAFIAISSANGRFGGLRTANVNYAATNGVAGVYAPGVAFAGPVFIGNVSASDSAKPMIVLGSASNTRITGGDLYQPNGQPVQVSGISQLRFTAGQDSHGNALVAKPNRAVLQQNGQDVTAQLVVNP